MMGRHRIYAVLLRCQETPQIIKNQPKINRQKFMNFGLTAKYSFAIMNKHVSDKVQMRIWRNWQTRQI